MANCVQQLTWHLKKDELELLLSDAGNDYSALEFKFCINPNADTQYFMRLVKVDAEVVDDVCTNAVQPVSREARPCPVPPDCDRNPVNFKNALLQYYSKGVITSTISKEDVMDAFR